MVGIGKRVRRGHAFHEGTVTLNDLVGVNVLGKTRDSGQGFAAHHPDAGTKFALSGGN